MDNQKTLPLNEIIPMYEGIYPSETISTVYSYLRERIDSLTPLVEANGKTPLITQAERENWEKGERRTEIERKSQNNKATIKTLEDCEIAWERLITGKANLCHICGSNISKDRKQAIPQATTCIRCRQEKGIHIHN